MSPTLMPMTYQRKADASDRPSTAGKACGHAARPHIALLTEAFPPHAGGSRIYYFNLFRRLALQFGYSVVVLTTGSAGSQQFDASETTGRLHIVRRSTALVDGKYRQLLRMLARVIRDLRWACSPRTDLLYVGDLFPQGVTALLANRITGTPYVIFAHGEEITQTDRFRYQPRLRNMIYRHAHTVIAANPFAREHLQRIGVRAASVAMICPGVDTKRFAPRTARLDLIERYRLQGKTVMLSVGRLVAHKGHSVLLEAMAALAGTTPAVHYLIAGRGPEGARLEAQARALGLGSHVTFLGGVQDAELADIYNLCDIFALGNREIQGEQEGFGMVFLEASASGKPVLGGRTGGTAAAILHGETGLLFDPEDPADATATLSLLLTQPAMRERLGEAGRAWVAANFCWDRSAAELHAISSRLLASAPMVSGAPVESHAVDVTHRAAGTAQSGKSPLADHFSRSQTWTGSVETL